MTTDAIKQLALASFRLIETGDEALALEIIHPDFVNREAQDDPEDADRQLGGPAGFLATAAWLREAFSDVGFEIQESAVDGPTVIVASTMTGTHTGAFQGIAPSGRPFRQKQVHIFTTADGKITEHRAVRDDLGLLFQLGWKPGRG